GGGPLGAQQRVGDVVRGDEGEAVEGGERGLEIGGGEGGETGEAGGDVRAVGGAQQRAEALQQPGAGVGGGAAAETDDERAGANVDGGAEQLSQAAGGGGVRGELTAGQRVQAHGLGQFEHGDVLLQRPAGGARCPGRAGDRCGVRGEAGGERGVDGAV